MYTYSEPRRSARLYRRVSESENSGPLNSESNPSGSEEQYSSEEQTDHLFSRDDSDVEVKDEKKSDSEGEKKDQQSGSQSQGGGEGQSGSGSESDDEAERESDSDISEYDDAAAKRRVIRPQRKNTRRGGLSTGGHLPRRSQRLQETRSTPKQEGTVTQSKSLSRGGRQQISKGVSNRRGKAGTRGRANVASSSSEDDSSDGSDSGSSEESEDDMSLACV